MRLHKFRSRAIRFNGFTDGIVVPTGQYGRGGGPARPTWRQYLGSTTPANSLYNNATKVGRLLLSRVGNVLNTLGGQFTVEASLCARLRRRPIGKAGVLHSACGTTVLIRKVMFGLETDNGFLTAETSFDLPVLMEDWSFSEEPTPEGNTSLRT